MKHLKAAMGFVLTLALAVAALAATPAAATAATPEDDVKTVVSRLQEYYLSQGDDIIIANGIYLARTSEALSYVQSQNPDGSWSDVDYADRTSSANGATWSAYIALYRMLALTHAYREAGAAGFQDPAVLAAVERALIHWDAVDPGNQNWWETEIGESIAMGRISVFLGDVLSPEALAVALKHNTGKLDPIGANGAWRTTNYLFEAVATRNLDDIASGFATIVATITADHSGTVQEAVQPDASFWAHGAQLYSEGYGMVLFTSAALWADVARGTSLAFSREQLDLLAFYIIEGTRWMIRGEIGMLYLNYRPPKTIDGVTSHASEFIEPLQRMARTDALYSTAYQAILDGVRGKTRTNGVTGDKYFWRSEFASHIRDEYAIFTRLNSSRTFGAELRTAYRDDLGNPVYWNAMGSTAIQVNNREYLDLGPTFDWWHYPGVTAPYEKRTERGVENRGRNGDGASFTGGVSDGEFGASVLTLDTAGTNAQKSYFAFDDEMVALGAGIRSTRDAPVHTTLNQAVSKSNASAGGESLPLGTDKRDVGNATWAYNDEVGYVFAAGQNVTVSNAAQRGSWIDEEPVEKNAFTLYVDHGVRPAAATYDYTVLPAATPAHVEAYAAKPAVRTLRNDTDVQAVRHDELNVTMATFFSPGTLDLGAGRTLSVDQPSIVILDERDEVPLVSIANPDRPGLVVRVDFEDGDADWHGVFALGAGENLGKTVTATLATGESPAASPFSASSTGAGSDVASLGDGDRETIWRSGAEGAAWVSQRLDRGAWATAVTIDWADEFATDFLVQTSEDGVTWTDHARVRDGAGAKSEIRLTPTPAAFVRVVLLEGESADVGIRELAVDSSVNLAIDGATRASGYAGYNLVHELADGNPDTRWRGNNANSAWAQIDLGRSQPVSTVRLSWEAAYAKTYKIQLSDDGSSWRDVYTTPAAGSDGGVDIITLEGQSARYVRMQTLTRALNYGPSLWEFEVFADRAVVDAPAVPAAVQNLALNRPTTADSVHNNIASIVAAKATDGASGTKWSSARQATEHWLQVDLEKVRSVSRAIVKWETGTSNDYRIEGSVDGTTWVPLARVQSAQPSLTHTHDFGITDVRYVRLTGLPATQYGLNIWELELYGGFVLDCADTVTAPKNGTAVVSATISPAASGDAFRAYSLDREVVRIAGESRAGEGGRIDVDVATGEPGVASTLITHGKGDEIAWCRVIVSADTATLEGLVDRANALSSAEYTTESWSPLLPALESAKVALATDGASQSDVDARAAALSTALDGLALLAEDDTVKPEATLVSPTAAGPFPVLEVRVDATDDTGLERIVANIYDKDGVLVKSTQTAANGAKAATHTASVTLPDGAYTVKYNASDLAGNVAQTGTFAFSIDATKPTATIKDGSSFTVKTGESYDMISFKLYDAQKIDKVTLNGKVKDLSNNQWSDVNFIKPPTFGAVQGVNTLVVYDVAGNTQTYTFTLN